MKRRNFILTSSLAFGAIPILSKASVSGATILENAPSSKSIPGKPVAITMWEFSWLERRWPGAGYEDWDLALNELTLRGYNAIRMDAFPHFFYNDPSKEYSLIPWWNTQDWGSPAPNKVTLMPSFIDFLKKCADRKIKIGLSSWFREDTDDVRMKLDTPEKLGQAWLKVLDIIQSAGLMDAILYVDLCNEWTGTAWCPFFVNEPAGATWTGWHTEKSKEWMSKSIDVLRQKYPDLPYTFSFTGSISSTTKDKAQLNMLDLLEPHIWMVSGNKREFYNEVGYNYERFDDIGFKNMQQFGESAYRKRPAYWNVILTDQIKYAAEWSVQSKLPLGTTECWGVVDYKDWPLLPWDYVKELCVIGVEEACKTERWLAIATSNFCGPQFVGMWRDIEWHKKMTHIIRTSNVAPDLRSSLLYKRLLK